MRLRGAELLLVVLDDPVSDMFQARGNDAWETRVNTRVRHALKDVAVVGYHEQLVPTPALSVVGACINTPFSSR